MLIPQLTALAITLTILPIFTSSYPLPRSPSTYPSPRKGHMVKKPVFKINSSLKGDSDKLVGVKKNSIEEIEEDELMIEEREEEIFLRNEKGSKILVERAEEDSDVVQPNSTVTITETETEISTVLITLTLISPPPSTSTSTSTSSIRGSVTSSRLVSTPTSSTATERVSLTIEIPLITTTATTTSSLNPTTSTTDTTIPTSSSTTNSNSATTTSFPQGGIGAVFISSGLIEATSTPTAVKKRSDPDPSEGIGAVFVSSGIITETSTSSTATTTGNFGFGQGNPVGVGALAISSGLIPAVATNDVGIGAVFVSSGMIVATTTTTTTSSAALITEGGSSGYPPTKNGYSGNFTDKAFNQTSSTSITNPTTSLPTSTSVAKSGIPGSFTDKALPTSISVAKSGTDPEEYLDVELTEVKNTKPSFLEKSSQSGKPPMGMRIIKLRRKEERKAGKRL